MAIAFDGNGRMYVVEMRTYMQDIDGTGEHDRKSRVSRHESTKGDGRFDKHAVFADGLVVPRKVLPLQDSVLIGDPKGATLKEPTAPNGGQWGLCQDDFGKPWFSNAGGEKGVWNFQTHVAYGATNVQSQWNETWMTVWPAVGLFDVQGGNSRHRDDGTVNHFTASCGQEIFRGDRQPGELRGNVFLPEPVARLIRRGTVEVKDGITTLTNPHGESEFIRITQPGSAEGN